MGSFSDWLAFHVFMIKLSQLMKPEDISFEVCRSYVTHICEPFKIWLGYLHESSRLAVALSNFAWPLGFLVWTRAAALFFYWSLWVPGSIWTYNQDFYVKQLPTKVSILTSYFPIYESELWIGRPLESSLESSIAPGIYSPWNLLWSKKGGRLDNRQVDSDRAWVSCSQIEGEGMWAGGF